MTRIALSIPILLLLSIGFVAEPFLSHIPTQPNPARIRQAGPSTDLQVGFDCGLGSTAAVLNATSFPVAPSENGSPEILTSCAWIGDAGQTVTGSNDGTTEPLVTDQDETLGTLVSPAIGGGFTADVVVLQNSTTTVIDGFDLKVSWNPAVLRAAQIDQTGLIWKSAVLLTPVNNIDNNNGVAELAQVIQGTIGGNITIFRLRFDVVGVGIANLHLTDVSGGLANPGHVVHSNIDSAFDSESFYDPNHSLGWAANLTQLNPLVPGSPETFLVNNSCPGCTGPFTLEWQFNSSNTNQFSSQFLGNPLTITLPNNTFVASRLTVHVIDSATPTPHSVALTENLPFIVHVQGPTTVAAESAASWTGSWIGGNPPYSGQWRLCPGVSTTTAVCSNPNPSFPSTSQQNTPTVNTTYHFAGVYNDTLSVTGSGTTSKTSFLVNVTGTQPAFNVTVTTAPTPSIQGANTTIVASVVYSPAYPTGSTFRSSGFTYMIDFGDGSSINAPLGLGTSFTTSHAYSSVGTYFVRVFAREASANTPPSHIQETGFATISVIPSSSADFSIHLAPSQASISPGDSTTSQVQVNTVGTNPLSVQLSTFFSIPGTTVSLTQTAGTTPFSSTLMITTSQLTPAGTFQITVQGSSNGTIHNADFVLTITTTPTNEPIIGVFSSHYGTSDITDASLTTGSKFSVQVNVTNAPFTGWNAYELVLYYDPNYINVSSYDVVTNTPFGSSGFVGPGTFNGPGALRLQVVDKGIVFDDSGMLVNITFTVLKTGGASPLTLAAGMAQVGSGAGVSAAVCPDCPPGAPDWTRMVVGSTLIGVQTLDGHFQNQLSTAGPIATFTYSPTSPAPGQMVTFNATGSFDPDNSGALKHGITQYIWDFGDISDTSLQTTTVPTITHVFKPGGTSRDYFSGNFSVRLTVIDLDNGFEGMTTTRLTIAPQENHDIAVTGLFFRLSVPEGLPNYVTVQIANEGTFTETYIVTVAFGPFDSTLRVIIGTQTGVLTASGIANNFFTLNTTGLQPGTYTITARASIPNDTNPLNDFQTGHFQVIPPDKPPIASFTFNPPNPAVNQFVSFNATGSYDPDGYITSYQWIFGDGFSVFGPSSTAHSYNRPGNFTVTLTVTDNMGLSGSTSMTIHVPPPPAHDVALVELETPNVAVSGQTVDFFVVLENTGTDSSSVDVTVYYNGTVAASEIGLTLPPGVYEVFPIPWNAAGVRPGNYTISATAFLPGDPTPADNSLTDGRLTLLPPPIIKLTPTNGPVGTTVIIHGTGFSLPRINQFILEVDVTFDNQFLGFSVLNNSTFTFIFNVPVSQPGVHQIHATAPFIFDAKASFTVTPPNGTVSVSISTGTIYFPGDSTTIFIATNLNGSPSTVTTLQVTLINPDNTNVTMKTRLVTNGLYKTNYTIPANGQIGTYALLVRAHLTGAADGQALTTFEVKPTWLSSNGRNITTAAAITGLVGVAALAWKKGYFKREDEDEEPENLNATVTATI